MATDGGTGNPLIDQLLAANPDLAAGLAGGTAAPTGPLGGSDLAAALLGSSMDVAGRYGLTGRDFGGVLPPWASGIASVVKSSPDWDPYLGVVSQGGDERVYFGEKDYKQVVGSTPPNKFASEIGLPSEPVTATTPGDRTRTVTQAMNMPYLWDEEQIAKAMERLKDAGIQVGSFDELVSAWGSLVNRAAMTYSLSEGQQKVTPWDVLDLYKKEAQASGTYVDPNRTESYTQRNVSEITEGQAWTSIQGTLSQMLGRDPSDQELRDFTYRMNHMAASNPSISKTITQYKNGEAVSSSTHTDPGFTSSDMAQEAYDSAQNDPEYAEFRGASYLFNAAMSALGPIGG